MTIDKTTKTKPGSDGLVHETLEDRAKIQVYFTVGICETHRLCDRPEGSPV